MRQIFILSLVLLVLLGCCKEQQPNMTDAPETMWKTPLSTGAETGSINPVLYKDLIIYCANDSSSQKSKLVALNRITGKSAWEWRYTDYQVGDFRISQTYTYNNILVFPILAGNISRLVAIDMNTGNRIWQNFQPGLHYELKGYKDKFYCLRILDGGKKSDIMVGNVNTGNWSPLYSVASQNEEPIFLDRMVIYDDTKNNKCLAFKIISDTSFSFRNIKYKLVKYNLDSSRIVYEKPLDYLVKGEYFLSGYQNGKLWLSSIGTHFYAIDEQTGNEALKILIPTTNQAGKMSLADGKVFIATEQIMYGYDAESGTRLWRENGTSGGLTSRQVYYNGILYFTSASTGKFHALDANTGKSIYNTVSPDKKGNGQGSFYTAITLDSINKRIYTATYFSALCYKMPN